MITVVTYLDRVSIWLKILAYFRPIAGTHLVPPKTIALETVNKFFLNMTIGIICPAHTHGMDRLCALSCHCYCEREQNNRKQNQTYLSTILRHVYRDQAAVVIATELSLVEWIDGGGMVNKTCIDDAYICWRASRSARTLQSAFSLDRLSRTGGVFH